MGTSRPGDGWATANDWASHRPVITTLYRDQNKTLKETMRIMENKYKFFATLRMYKARFQQWEIEKKIKAEDAVEIFRHSRLSRNGLLTEKEMQRHVKDKHTSAPKLYECKYKPCSYKSKRESNCKQHMEKAHGWTFEGSKAPKTPRNKADNYAYMISESSKSTRFRISQTPNPLQRLIKNPTDFRRLEHNTISRDNTADEETRRSASFAYLGSKLTSCHNRSLKLKSVQTGAQTHIKANESEKMRHYNIPLHKKHLYFSDYREKMAGRGLCNTVESRRSSTPCP
ncbi:Clr5 domain-containing protein [Xylaria venustula]|nr:Clr5 domain-containing protein [Xylaria venustula]